MSALGITAATIDTCATGAEGIGLLRTDQLSSASKGVNASPTLFIKGVKYTGAISPNAYKQAICKAFITPPTECQTALSSTATGATGSCG
jgi:protein-disulfide isomerase